MAFESLSDKLQNIFKNLRGKGRLSEADVKAALREVKTGQTLSASSDLHGDGLGGGERHGKDSVGTHTGQPHIKIVITWL